MRAGRWCLLCECAQAFWIVECWFCGAATVSTRPAQWPSAFPDGGGAQTVIAEKTA